MSTSYSNIQWNINVLLLQIISYCQQESLALASMARDDPPASSMASSKTAAMCSKVGSEYET